MPPPDSPTESRDLSAELRRHRDRVRRIVSIRFAARLEHLLCEGELSEEVERLAPFEPSSEDGDGAGSRIQLLALLVERELRRPGGAPSGETVPPRRTLHVDSEDWPSNRSGGPRRGELADQERALDARVAELEPTQREVILLRDYCGADWELVCRRLGLLSVDGAQELYRRAHGALRRRLARAAASSSGP